MSTLHRLIFTNHYIKSDMKLNRNATSYNSEFHQISHNTACTHEQKLLTTTSRNCTTTQTRCRLHPTSALLLAGR